MNFTDEEVSPFKRFGGLGVVVLFHLLLLYALVTGLARTMIDVIQKPMEATIITEVTPPPEQVKPPPSPPKANTPPLPFAPPPDVATQTPQQPDTMATTDVPPDADSATTSPTTDDNANAPPAPVPAFADLNACKPAYPKAAFMSGETGTVRVRFVIGANSQLVSASVLRSSGYKDLDRATIGALSRCQFRAAMQDGGPIQSAFTSDYVWKLE